MFFLNFSLILIKIHGVIPAATTYTKFIGSPNIFQKLVILSSVVNGVCTSINRVDCSVVFSLSISLGMKDIGSPWDLVLINASDGKVALVINLVYVDEYRHFLRL